MLAAAVVIHWVHLFFVVLVAACAVGLFWWAVDAIELIPPPFKKVLRAILIVAALIFLVNILFSLLGHSWFEWDSSVSVQ